MNKMHNLYFDSMKEFASCFIEDLEDLKKYEDIAYIGNFEDVIELTNELVRQDCSVYNISDLNEEYETLYILEMSEDKKIWICPISWSLNKSYVHLDDKIVYFSKSSSKEREAIINVCDCIEEWYNVLFDDNCEECSEKYDCPYYDGFENKKEDVSNLHELKIDLDDDMHGFTISGSKDGSYWSKSFWTSEKLTENKIDKVFDKFNDLFDFSW